MASLCVAICIVMKRMANPASTAEGHPDVVGVGPIELPIGTRTSLSGLDVSPERSAE